MLCAYKFWYLGVGFTIVAGCIFTWAYEGITWSILAHLPGLVPSTQVKLNNTFNYRTNALRAANLTLRSLITARGQPDTYEELAQKHLEFARRTNAIIEEQQSKYSKAYRLHTYLWTTTGCSDIPSPFNKSMTEIYVEGWLAKWTTARNQDMLLLGLSDPAKYCGAMVRLVKDGLKWNHFGIDFSDVVQKRGLAWTMDEDVQIAMALYWGRNWNTNLSVVQVDYELRYRPRDLSMFVYGHRDRFSDFFRDGYLRITDLGIDVEKLKEEIRIAKGYDTWENLHHGLDNHGSNDYPWFRNMHFPSLDPLMNNKAILELISFYVGSDVVINGYMYWHVNANATTQEMRVTGEWHHDSCGTRTKMFVYLHDVHDDGMVTEVAAGSQKHLKYTFGSVHPWFTTQAVQKAWKVDKMVGPAGGGFLFDPNTIHRASTYKAHLARDVVIIDISSAVKSEVGIYSGDWRRPCPVHTWRTAKVNSRFNYPEKTHGPITRDLVRKNGGRNNYEEYYKEERSKRTEEEYAKLLDQRGGSHAKQGKHRQNIKEQQTTATPSETITRPKPKGPRNPCEGKGKTCRVYGM